MTTQEQLVTMRQNIEAAQRAALQGMPAGWPPLGTMLMPPEQRAAMEKQAHAGLGLQAQQFTGLPPLQLIPPPPRREKELMDLLDREFQRQAIRQLHAMHDERRGDGTPNWYITESAQTATRKWAQRLKRLTVFTDVMDWRLQIGLIVLALALLVLR